MWGLQPLPMATCVAHLDDIVTSKSGDRGERLAALLPLVLHHYQAFARHEAQLRSWAEPVAWSDQDKLDLQHTYTSSTQALGVLKQALRRAQSRPRRRRCPYCGLKEGDQWDHWLPKEKWPEYAVLGRNLVPACGTCNQTRDPVWASTLRPFSEAPDRQPTCISVALTLTALPSARFALSLSPAASPRFVRQLERHVQRLHLLERWAERSEETLARLHGRVRRERAAGTTTAELVRNLVAEADTLDADFGPNHWETVLYRALSRHRDIHHGRWP